MFFLFILKTWLCAKKHVKQYVHLISKINWNSYSEYSHLILQAVQRYSLKMLFHRKHLWWSPIIVKLQIEVLQLFYNKTPPQVFSFEFIIEHPWTAASSLPLIKLLFSTIKLKFSVIFSHLFCTISHF